MERPWEYRWSSAAVYALGRPDLLVQELNPCYLELAPTAAGRQAHWQELLQAADPLEESVRQAEHFLGDEAFQLRMQQEHGRPIRRRRGRPGKVSAAPGQRLLPDFNASCLIEKACVKCHHFSALNIADVFLDATDHDIIERLLGDGDASAEPLRVEDFK